MAADGLMITEQWIRDKLKLQHACSADVRSLTLPGSYEGKICHVGSSLKNFVRLKALDLSHNALITVKGIEHLELLETLNLYYNRLESLQDVFSLHKLQNLKDLDLRLNPVVRRHPHYRLYLVHAMTKLRKLDDCPVRDRERKAALLHFSSETNLDVVHKKPISTQDTSFRSSELRIKAVERMMKTISLLEGNEEAVFNEVCKHQTLSSRSPRLLQEISSKNACGPSIQNQEPIQKISDFKNEADVHAGRGHRVTFVSPVIVESRHVMKTHGTVRGESIFTPHPTDTRSALQEDDHHRPLKKQTDENSLNPVLHPLRLTYRTSDRSPSDMKPCRGAYRKPMELLLGMMEERWSGKKENHQDWTFLLNMVHILTMMEKDVVDGEQEIQTLKETLTTLNSETQLQQKQHHDEIQALRLQLQHAQESVEAVNGQLKSVLEENVCLQKQLIRTEEKLLTSRLRKRTDGDELCGSEEMNRQRHRVQEHQREIQPAQENYKLLIARNECLLQELEEALIS